MASSAPALSCPSRSAASQARPRLVLTPSHFGSAGGLLCTRESMRQIFTQSLLTPPTFRARRTGRSLNTVHLQLVSASERASTRAAIDPTRAHRPDRRPLAMPARVCSRPLVSACVRSRPLVSARVRSCQLVSARVLSICGSRYVRSCPLCQCAPCLGTSSGTTLHMHGPVRRRASLDHGGVIGRSVEGRAFAPCRRPRAGFTKSKT